MHRLVHVLDSFANRKLCKDFVCPSCPIGEDLCCKLVKIEEELDKRLKIKKEM